MTVCSCRNTWSRCAYDLEVDGRFSATNATTNVRTTNNRWIRSTSTFGLRGGRDAGEYRMDPKASTMTNNKASRVDDAPSLDRS